MRKSACSENQLKLTQTIMVLPSHHAVKTRSSNAYIYLCTNSWIGPLKFGQELKRKSACSENQPKLTQTILVVPSQEAGKTLKISPSLQMPTYSCASIIGFDFKSFAEKASL